VGGVLGGFLLAHQLDQVEVGVLQHFNVVGGVRIILLIVFMQWSLLAV